MKRFFGYLGVFLLGCVAYHFTLGAMRAENAYNQGRSDAAIGNANKHILESIARYREEHPAPTNRSDDAIED